MKQLKKKYLNIVQLFQSDFPGRMIKLVFVFAIYFVVRSGWSDFTRGFNDVYNNTVLATPKMETPSFNLNSIVFKILKFF